MVEMRIWKGVWMTEKMEELLPLVAELADKYTSKESTSISYHTARQLMGAVIYCVQQYSQQGGIPTGAVWTVDSPVSVREAYQRGYQMVLDQVEQTRNLYHEILPEFYHYGNRAYQDTFEKGIPVFFARYDARFEPQNHILTLDYPVLAALLKKCGINVVYPYIDCIGMEQRLLNRLPDSYIRHVLRAYHQEYEELIINVAAIVLRNLVGCMLAGKEVTCREYSSTERQCINAVINGHTTAELELILASQIDELVRQVTGTDQKLGSYLKLDVHNFAFELKTSYEYGCLERVLAIA